MDKNLISDLSYTNKDFNAIYPELLDLVKKLTNKWDPSLSNESDPGVILLKLNAIIADKNNYNIDKNILECFPASVTQEGNARRLYESLGYKMHWYRSAVTKVNFLLRSTKDLEDGFYTIPQFTSLVDSTGEVMYTILNNVTLQPSSLNEPVYVSAIEGSVMDYTINGSKLVTVANLDNSLRLYFQDTMIAENGIFIAENPGIEGISSDDLTFSTEYVDTLSQWKRVDNLAAYPLNSKVYEFGVLPNTNTCYIEFPQDIATLIPNGIYLKYTITKGAQGNIKSNILSLFYEDQESDEGNIINESIKISQPYSAIDGEDPETIDDAYKNYKRTIGTFNTLVTCRDYENFIYNLKSEGKPMVSNTIVSDRTSDVNFSNYMQVWYPAGSRQELITDKLNAYNILLYCLKQPVSVYNKATYDESFNNSIDSMLEQDIEVALSESQSVQHDIKFIDNRLTEAKYDDDGSLVEDTDKNSWPRIFSVENTIALKGSLITYNKVSKTEALDIENNVLSALYKKYNARNVVFGSDIPYEDLVETIQSADSRIRMVALDIPVYQPVYKMLGSPATVATPYDPYDSSSETDFNNELVARMVLAGNVQLFKFDTDFEYDFGQDFVDGGVISVSKSPYGTTDVIKSISTETQISIGEPVRENELLQIVEPNLVTTTEYSTYVRYYLDGVIEIPKGKNYKLGEGESISLYYKDATSGVYKTDKIGVGKIICPSVRLKNDYTTTEAVYSSWKQLQSGETLSVKDLNQSHLIQGTKCYFITNTSDNSLHISSSEPKILQENEYFIYTNENSNELVILGSGTMISLQPSAISETESSNTFDATIELMDLSDITNDNIENIDWIALPQDLYVTELKITTVGKGCSVKLFDDKGVPISSAMTIGNDAQEVTNTIVIYNGKDEVDTIEPCVIDGMKNLIQSRLNISATQYSPQLLYSGQKFELTYVFLDGNGEPIDDNSVATKLIEGAAGENAPAIMFNSPVVLSGGKNIDVKILDDYGQHKYLLRLLKFKEKDFCSYNKDLGKLETEIGLTSRNSDGLIVLNHRTLAQTGTKMIDGKEEHAYSMDITYNFTFTDDILLPIYVDCSTPGAKVGFYTDASSNTPFGLYGGSETETAVFSISSEGGKIKIDRPYTLHCNSSNVLHVVVTDFGENDSVTIGKIYKHVGYNTDEIDVKDLNHEYNLLPKSGNTEATSNAAEVLNIMKRYLTDTSKFNWTYIVPDVNKVMYPTSADSYWNENHIYNKYTIPKIDFDNTKIKVNPVTLV